MNQIPPLYRTHRTKTIHRQDCLELAPPAIPWAWAVGRTLGEVRMAMAEQGGTECQTCKPLGGAS